MAYLENTGSPIPQTSAHRNGGFVNPASLEALSPSAVRSSLSGFMHLAPETRNAIYRLVLDSPLSFFIVAIDGITPGFRLGERSDQPQYEALQSLQALSSVNKEIRREIPTSFYAVKHFLILPYGYKYLSIFVHWLAATGSECRAVLRNVCFAGYMSYEGSAALTRQFHGLLRGCTGLRVLTVQVNVWHLCEGCTADVDNFLNFKGLELHDGSMPEVDVSAWADTSAQLPGLRTFRLDMVMSVDRSRKSMGKKLNYMRFNTERCKALADNVERQLRKSLDSRSRRDIKMSARFGGADERVYVGRPW